MTWEGERVAVMMRGVEARYEGGGGGTIMEADRDKKRSNKCGETYPRGQFSTTLIFFTRAEHDEYCR